MAQDNNKTGIDFARAVSKHFKLPDSTDASIELIASASEIFGVKVKLLLTADDLVAIGQHMRSGAGHAVPGGAAAAGDGVTGD